MPLHRPSQVRCINNSRAASAGGTTWKARDENHHYTREERQRLNDVESIDYLPPNSAVYRRWLAQQPWG